MKRNQNVDSSSGADESPSWSFSSSHFRRQFSLIPCLMATKEKEPFSFSFQTTDRVVRKQTHRHVDWAQNSLIMLRFFVCNWRSKEVECGNEMTWYSQGSWERLSGRSDGTLLRGCVTLEWNILQARGGFGWAGNALKPKFFLESLLRSKLMEKHRASF